MTMSRRAPSGALILALAFAGAACGDDDDSSGSGSPSPAEETTTTAGDGGEASGGEDGPVVEVRAVDYAFEAMPETVAAGTRFSLVNEGSEPHEFVAVRIPDEETRPVVELLALPEEQLFGEVFGGEPEPAVVILAATGTTDQPGVVVGDGTITEPGRYAVVCFLPVGATDDVLDPEAEGPPESDAPPHASQGMFAELVVE